MASRLPRSELLVVRLEGPLPSLATERRRPSVTLRLSSYPFFSLYLCIRSISGIEIGMDHDGPSWIMDRILNFGGDTESTCSDSILLTAVGFAPLWAPSGWSKAPAQKKGSEGSGSTTCGRSRALRAQTCSKNWKHLIEALFLHIWTCSELNLIPFHIGLQPLLQCRKRSPGLWRPEGDEHVSKILIWKMLRSISICFYFNAKYTENIQKVGTLSVRSETCLPESWPSRNAGAQWNS